MGTLPVLTLPRVVRRTYVPDYIVGTYLEVYLNRYLTPQQNWIRIFAVIANDDGTFTIGPSEVRLDPPWSELEIPFESLTEQEQSTIWAALINQTYDQE